MNQICPKSYLRSKTEKLHFCACPWSLLTVLNFFTRELTDTTVFLLLLVGETIRVFVYKTTENNFGLWDFTELIQTQKRYSFSLDKISILTEMLLVMPCQKFSLKLTRWEVTLCEISHIYLYSFKSLRKLVLFTLFLKKVKKSSWEIFKLMRNILPNKTEKPESFKNNHNNCKAL